MYFAGQGLGLAISSYASVIFVSDDSRKAGESGSADGRGSDGEPTRLRMEAILIGDDSQISDADFRCRLAISTSSGGIRGERRTYGGGVNILSN